MKPSRPLLRWHGGKWRIAPWIISQFPPHRYYTETFGGAASVLLQKPRAFAEVYNDLDGELVNLFRVLQKPRQAENLIYLLKTTPFARKEFNRSYGSIKEPIEKARRLVIRSFMGFGSNAHTASHKTGFRSFSNRSHTTPAHDWANFPIELQIIVERLQGVVIENRPAIEIMSQHDTEDTLHYCDPPYLMSTRTDRSRDYNHELTDNDHVNLANFLRTLKGMVIVSGYDSPLYDKLFSDYKKMTKKAFADGARERLECLWISPNAQRRMKGLL